MLTDIEIAQQAHMLPIAEVAAGIGIDADDLEFYGKYKADENEVLERYIEAAPREIFADILDKIDNFVFFDSRKL